ncbi:MAG: tryptophan synthase subunit alpha [Spirochaetia bacterium]|nr:tryptophan synthase subunit alpha [Spirochaetia bacterium]
MLENEIASRRKSKDILIMAHIVLGYPSFDASRKIVDQMVQAGVDLIELQIPFSEPIADGPVILHANQKALANGSTVDECMKIAGELAKKHPIPFLFMTYFNPVFVRGVERFAKEMHDAGLKGAIIPDLPHEEGKRVYDALIANNIDPIFLFSPNTSPERMKSIGAQAHGFIYCIARKGVTGAETQFALIQDYLAQCRKATQLPLALGFGVKNRQDVDGLIGKVDIAVVGSETIRLIDESGVEAVGPFIRSLRSQ